MIDFGSATASPEASPSATPLLAQRLAAFDQIRSKPLLKSLPYTEPLAVYELVRQRSTHSFLFESAPGPERLSAHTFIGFEPAAVFALRDGSLYQDGQVLGRTQTPLAELRRLLQGIRTVTLPGFKYTGGLVGYFSYDFVEYLEVVRTAPSVKVFPDFKLGLYLDGVIFDHRAKRSLYFTHGEDRSSLLERINRTRVRARPTFECGPLHEEQSQGEFTKAVESAREFICAGEVYQLVLSRQLRAGYRGDLLSVYQHLRQINPSPYMFFVESGPHRIVGSSPEMLLSVQDRRVTTFPIAGTRPVGSTSAQTAAYAQELLRDEKELAEHNMLVDLARNDVSRVSQYGSVHVPDYLTVERFSHVQHLVSRVVGRLRPDVDALDAFAAVFPAGTVSGAPKVRAMELIAQFEPSARGPYAGAVGYFSFNGNMDTAIAIRTAFANERDLYLQSGAGIVYDSDPEREYAETEQKLQVITAAVKGGCR